MWVIDAVGLLGTGGGGVVVFVFVVIVSYIWGMVYLLLLLLLCLFSQAKLRLRCLLYRCPCCGVSGAVWWSTPWLCELLLFVWLLWCVSWFVSLFWVVFDPVESLGVYTFESSDPKCF